MTKTPDPPPSSGASSDDPTLDLPASDPSVTSGDLAASILASQAEQGAIGLKEGDQFGQFTIKGVLGEGGMGVVYRAQQQHPKRDIALKLIRPGLLSETLLRRFQLEAEILARLNHPGIAHVYHADVHGGVPYFAMELIEGQPLSEHASGNKLSTRQRLDLFIRICAAVQHAHQKGVIHRDLKPANILVDQAGQPKILDFGVARATDIDIQVTAVDTNVGQLVGTVPYMSPEQAAGDPADIDTRSDVYALGVILFELLSMRMPYDLSKKIIHEAVRIIREDEPTRLSSISRSLRGDIDTIVGKALEKDKDRRYQSASAMAEDIQRYLGNEPITARPPSLSYQLGKFAARNKTLMGGVAAVFLVLVGGIAATSLALDRALEAESLALDRLTEANTARAAEETATELANNRANQLEVITDFQSDMLSEIDPEAMGATLRRQFGEELRASLVKQGATPEEIEDAVRKFRGDMPWFNPTNAAIKLLDDHILGRAVDTIDRQFLDQPLTRAALQRTLGNSYFAIGRYEPAARLHEAALATRRAELGEQHPETLDSLLDLGRLYFRQGRYDEAEPLQVKALADRAKLFGDEHPDTLDSMNALGMLYTAMGQYDKAEGFLKDALEIRQRILGDEHLKTLESMENLAIVDTDLARFDEAEQLLVAALDIKRSVFGETHRATLSSMNLLGTLYRVQGRLDDAEPLLVKSLEIKRPMLGDEHPGTLNSMVNLGDLYREQGRFPEAERIYVELLAIKKRVLGEEHPLTLDSMNGLASVYLQQGNLTNAESLLVNAYAIQKRVLGPRHPKTLVIMSNLGSLYWGQGLFDKAEPFFVENLKILQETLGSEHSTTLEVMNNVSILYQKQGRFDEAEPMMVSLLEIRRRLLGDEHPKTLISMNTLGSLYMEQGRYAEAEPVLSDALQVMTATLSQKHPNTVLTMCSLGELYQKLDRHEDADELLARTVTAAQGIWPKGMWIIGAFQAIRGRSLVALKRFEDAEAHLDEGYGVLITSVGPTNEYTIGAVESYIELYSRWHQVEPDKGYDAKAERWRAELPSASEAASENGG